MAENTLKILIIIAAAAVFMSGCTESQDGFKDTVSGGTDREPGQIQKSGDNPSGTMSDPVQTGAKEPGKKDSPAVTAPSASVVAANNPDTPGADVKITHKGGDTLKGGDWKLSIVPMGSSPTFITSAQGSDFGIADSIIASTVTEGAIGLTDSALTGGEQPLEKGALYDVKMVHIPANAMMVDQVMEVR